MSNVTEKGIQTVKSLSLPLSEDDARSLRAGDMVELTGVLYTARDAAHNRLCQLIEDGKPLPADLRGQCIYYVGPTPASPGRVVGSAGPTTSARMDGFVKSMKKIGLRATIGKGNRSPEVIEAIKEGGCVYFAAIGGAAALIGQCIKEVEVIAWEDLGCEALRRMRVEKMPVIVAIDSLGHNLYQPE